MGNGRLAALEGSLSLARRELGYSLRIGPFVGGLFVGGLFVGFVVAGLPSPAAAGPPFLTDDPEPVDYGRWEIIGFSMGTLVQGDTAGFLPGVEVNYGARPNVQLHVKVSAAFNSQSVTGTQFGYGDTEFGVKYRFINPDEDDWWPQVAVYPVVVAPTGDTARGLGSGAVHAVLPLWVQKAGENAIGDGEERITYEGLRRAFEALNEPRSYSAHSIASAVPVPASG